ncbi:MAG: hypothetical protein RL508_781 [Actinomycetota bacterium]|jgi:proteasome accessory factor C
MPKRNTIYGSDRTNLMWTLVGKILDAGSIPVQELADIFDLSYDEIERAVRTIGVTETGGPFDQHPFMVNYEALAEGIAEFNDYPLDLQVPRLSSHQAATISAGLRYLASVPGFTLVDEVTALLALMEVTSAEPPVKTIDFVTGSVDSDVEILRGALTAGKAVSFSYINGAGVRSDRVIEPLRLESIEPIWYLRGYDQGRGKVLAFRLDRMDNVQVLDQEVTDEARSAEISEEIYIANDTDHIVTVDVLPEAYSLISEFAANDPSSKQTGTKRVTIRVRELNVLGPVIASYGGFATVVAPPEAIAAVRDFALRGLGEAADSIEVE